MRTISFNGRRFAAIIACFIVVSGLSSTQAQGSGAGGSGSDGGSGSCGSSGGATGASAGGATAGGACSAAGVGTAGGLGTVGGFLNGSGASGGLGATSGFGAGVSATGMATGMATGFGGLGFGEGVSTGGKSGSGLGAVGLGAASAGLGLSQGDKSSAGVGISGKDVSGVGTSRRSIDKTGITLAQVSDPAYDALVRSLPDDTRLSAEINGVFGGSITTDEDGVISGWSQSYPGVRVEVDRTNGRVTRAIGIGPFNASITTTDPAVVERYRADQDRQRAMQPGNYDGGGR